MNTAVATPTLTNHRDERNLAAPAEDAYAVSTLERTLTAKATKLLGIVQGKYLPQALCAFDDGVDRWMSVLYRHDVRSPLLVNLTEKEKEAIVDFVHPWTKQPDGTKARAGCLSCIVERATARGAYISTDYFVVEPEPYGEGWITGLHIAKELFEALASPETNPFARLVLRDVLAGAYREIEKNVPYDMPSSWGAAAAVVFSASEMLVFAARKANCTGYFADQIERQTELHRDNAQREAASKAKFVERMRAAREAKRSLQVRAQAERQTKRVPAIRDMREAVPA